MPIQIRMLTHSAAFSSITVHEIAGCLRAIEMSNSSLKHQINLLVFFQLVFQKINENKDLLLP